MNVGLIEETNKWLLGEEKVMAPVICAQGMFTCFPSHSNQQLSVHLGCSLSVLS
jgi:hypothetical protein